MSDSYASRSVAMSKFRDSEKGQAITRQSKISAVNYLFDLEDSENNAEAQRDLEPIVIFEAIQVAGKLDINVDGKDYTLTPAYPEIALNDDLALRMLEDVQANLEISMLGAALPDSVDAVEMLPGATAGEIMDVDVTEYVGDYDRPEEVPEWVWIAEKASFISKDNGKDGIWDHILNTALDHGPIPSALKDIFDSAQAGSFRYILFHQGT